MRKSRLFLIIGICSCIVISSVVLSFVFRCALFGHKYEDTLVEAVCGKSGYTLHTCKICGNKYTDNRVPSLRHQLNYEIVGPTCTEQGYKEEHCELCNHKRIVEYYPAEHNYVIVAPANVTCTESGDETSTCAECGYTQVEHKNALGHSISYTKDIPVTCAGDGIKSGECSRCGEIVEEVTPALGHDWLGDSCFNCGNINPEYVSQTLVHTSNKYIEKVYAHSGKLTFKCTYTGSGNIIIKLRDQNQDLVELVCNEIGDYVVDKKVDVSPGWYYIEIYGSSGSWSWTLGGYYWDYHLAKNAINDYRNAHPDEILSCYDLMAYFMKLGISEKGINAVDIFNKVPDGFYNGAAMTDAERIVYFDERGFSREAIIKWYVDLGYSTEKATALVDTYLK